MMLDCSTRFSATFGSKGEGMYYIRTPSGGCLYTMAEIRMAGATRIELEVDDGPFYLRHTLRAGVTTASADVRGFLEVVDVDRVDRRWQRPFVRMRVSTTAASSSSLWHPLFAGSRAGRVGRQLRWLLGGRP